MKPEFKHDGAGGALTAWRVFHGHHKTGTQWVRRIVGALAAARGARHLELISIAQLTGSSGFVTIGNARQDLRAALPPHRAIHVVRDPRDMLVSAYFSHLHSHPVGRWQALVAQREKLRVLAPEDGMFATLEFIAHVFVKMAQWDYDRADTLELRFEDFLADERGAWRRALDHLDLADFATADLEAILHANSFSAITGGRAPGVEDPTHHFRRGVAGDWRRHFSPRLIEAFKQRHNPLLLRLGYVDDADWS